MRDTLATRPLTLRVPIANEDERVHFQRRLALTAGVVAALSFGFFMLTVIIIAVLKPGLVQQVLTRRSSHVHIATSATAALVWLAMRRGRHSVKVLSTLDLVSSVGLCGGWAALAGSGIPLAKRPEMIALLACSFTLVLRAALVPSTPARTALFGLTSMTPTVLLAVMLYADEAPATRELGLPPVIDTVTWGLLGVAATTVISLVIYGLRQEVRKARHLGQYLLEEKIGEGGMGVVYRASHAMLRRPTAIKLLSATASQAAKRFEREVQITARLTHPNTIAIFDYGRTPDGIFYYAMEYLEGITLEDLVSKHGPQPARRVAYLILQICGALKEAHAAGLVHRDIKPANVMLTERGGLADVVKVLDFGLVKESDGANMASTLPPVQLRSSASDLEKGTIVNTIMGTPHYMSPEAIVDPSSIDGRADLYAVGVTAYVLLTGKPLFDGSNLVEICSAHLHEPPPRPSKLQPDVPKSLDRIVLACLAKTPAERPKDADELAEMIRSAALGEWTQADARAWWTAQRSNESARREKSGREHTSSRRLDGFGNTIAVALGDRAAS
jgi:eukaryotic-like serine/threonine-protein kinase